MRVSADVEARLPVAKTVRHWHASPRAAIGFLLHAATIDTAKLGTRRNLSMPGISVTVILGFIFCWNAFNYPLMLAGRQTFPVTVGAIQFISYEQVLWGQMAAATIVAALPQLVLSLMVQKYIVRGLTMGAVK